MARSRHLQRSVTGSPMLDRGIFLPEMAIIRCITERKVWWWNLFCSFRWDLYATKKGLVSFQLGAEWWASQSINISLKPVSPWNDPWDLSPRRARLFESCQISDGVLSPLKEEKWKKTFRLKIASEPTYLRYVANPSCLILFGRCN